jgi:hypothetical protein
LLSSLLQEKHKMEDFDQDNLRVDIPGLPDTEIKGKKGKRKGNNKKTLTLQTFLQDENQEIGDSADNSETDPMESHFAKLNLDDEELIVMESCHSYIHDLLKQLGPTNAMDPILQQEINNFPPEAKRVMQKCGGYRNFILRSKDLAVVDKIVAAKTDLKNAQEMAFKEIYSNLPNMPPPATKNDNIHSEQTKDIWNSKASVNSHAKSPEPQRSDFSIFGEQQSGNSLYYQSSNTGQTTENEYIKSHGVIGNGGSARQHLMKGLNMPDNLGNNFDVTSQLKSLEEFKEKNWKLTETNNELLKKLQEKEGINEELKNLQAKHAGLEAQHKNTKNELIFCRSELENYKAELAKIRAEKMTAIGGDSGELSSSDGDIIFGLQKQLQGEQLKNINLTNELETQRKLQGGSGANLILKGGETKPPGFYTGPGQVGRSLVSSGWDHGGSSTTLGLGPSDGDPLGLRSLFPLDSQQPISSQSQAFSSTSESTGSFLQGNPMFGGLGAVGPPTNQISSSTWGEFKPRPINKSASSIGLGLNSMNLNKAQSPILDPIQQNSSVFPLPSSSPGLQTSSGSGFQLAGSSSGLFSQPPPLGNLGGKAAAPSPALGVSSSLAGGTQQAAGVTAVKTASINVSSGVSSGGSSGGKLARQEQLIKKLVAMIPGTDEATIRKCIEALRERHGKLSGWPTSKIASQIAELLKSDTGVLKD